MHHWLLGNPSDYTATPGSQITFDLAFTNNSSSAAPNVAVRDILDPNLTYVSCTSTTGLTTNSTCSQTGGTVTWSTISSLPSGATGHATVTATVPSTSSFSVVNEGNIVNPQSNIDPNSGDSKITITNPPAGKRNTSTGVNCTPNPLTYGGNTSCTATVTDVASGTKSAPTGTVTFSDGGAAGTLVAQPAPRAAAPAHDLLCHVHARCSRVANDHCYLRRRQQPQRQQRQHWTHRQQEAAHGHRRRSDHHLRPGRPDLHLLLLGGFVGTDSARTSTRRPPAASLARTATWATTTSSAPALPTTTTRSPTSRGR